MAGLNIKNEVLYRVYAVLVLLVLFAAAIVFQTAHIVIVEGPSLRAKKADAYIRTDTIEAQRGSIYSNDGKLLATSLPLFEIRMDLMTIDEKLFQQNIDSLALCLATYVDKIYTPGGMKEYLIQKRAEEERFLLIKKNVDYKEKKFISGFPIFREGQFKGGFIARPTHNRVYPFGQIARRTIGYSRNEVRKVGLEGYFDNHMKGEAGGRLVFKVSGDTWIPIDDFSGIEPQKGGDVVTTIDVDIQDITHRALYDGLNYHDADFGVAMVMDVKTGAILAMSNIGRLESGWYESYNYSIGSAIEPGSTFKLASVMALLEENPKISLEDTIPLFNGRRNFYEEEMVDASYHNLEKATLKTAFEISSNVGIATIIDTTFNKEGLATKFIDRLKKFNLHLPTGIQLEGEAAPYLKDAYSTEDNWSGTTLPWMSTGYEVALTPLQLLTFYNAVANNGTMMKPYLVTELLKDEKVVQKFRPTVIKKKIASDRTIEMAQQLLEGVVRNGTAKELQSNVYDFAGKTGTAQINYLKSKRKDQLTYRASFAGYFPAENPQYSVVVVVSKPSRNGRYGGEVAGPIFRRIADEVFEARVAINRPFNVGPAPRMTDNQLPRWRAGNREDFEYLLNYFALPHQQSSYNEWAVVRPFSDTAMLEVVKRTIYSKQVPNVVGMGLRDALYALENNGLKVQANGYGRVVQQSIIPGTKARGQTIRLHLN